MKKESKLTGEIALLVQTRIFEVFKLYEIEVNQKMETPWYKVKLYIDQNFRQSELDVKKLAEDYFMEVRAMKDNFKREFYRFPYDYFIRLKMDEAKRLIRLNDGKTFTAIALEVGSDPKNFSTQYKRAFGYPPSEELLQK